MTNSLWNSPLDAAYAGKLTRMPRQLVFIMGCHRSGTSMLYHLLAYTGAFEYLSAYDVIKYGEIVANRVEGREESVKAAVDAAIRLETTRGIDNLPVGADYPEEYRFLLTVPPPAWILDAHKDEGRQVFPPHLTPDTLDVFLEICHKKEYLGSGDKPLILKNPNDHYFNFAQIHQMFPEARMIFIHRHPLHILNSYIVSVRRLLETKSEYLALLDPGYGAVFQSTMSLAVLRRLFEGDYVARTRVAALSQSYAYYLENIQRLAPDQYISLRYEDLCRDPETHLQEIGRFLNNGMTPKIPEQFVSPRRPNVTPQLLAAYRERAGDMREYLESQGYSLFPEGFIEPAPV